MSAPMTMPPAYSHATMVVPVFGASCAWLMLSMCAFAREFLANLGNSQFPQKITDFLLWKEGKERGGVKSIL